MVNFDANKVEIHGQGLELPTILSTKIYKIVAEETKVLAKVFVLEITDGREIQIYWNDKYITEKTDSDLLATIRETIPGYEHYKAGTTVVEYSCQIRSRYDIKYGMGYKKVFNTKNK